MADQVQTATLPGPATFTVTFTARGEVRKAFEALSKEGMADALVTAVMKDAAGDDGAGDVDATDEGQAWARALVTKDAEGEGGDQRYVLGVVMEPDTEDTQGDHVSAEEILKAQRAFMEAYAEGYGKKTSKRGHMGRMHKSIVDGKVVLLESWIQTADAEIAGQPVKKGTWMQAVLVRDDEMWADVKKGNLTGFSIGGLATRVKRAA